MRYRVLAFGLAISTLSCAATASQESARVRVTGNSDVVRGCEFIGNAKVRSILGGSTAAAAEDELVAKLRNEAAGMGGNVVYMPSTNTQSAVATGRAEIYRCPTGTPAVPAPAAAPAAPSQAAIAPGFRDLRWGDPVPPGMEEIGAKQDSRLFVRKSDTLKLGPVELKKIAYVFEKGQLRLVVMTPVTTSLAELKGLLTQQWGTPTSDHGGDAPTLWSSEDPRLGKTIAGLEKNKDSGLVTITLISPNY